MMIGSSIFRHLPDQSWRCLYAVGLRSCSRRKLRQKYARLHLSLLRPEAHPRIGESYPGGRVRRRPASPVRLHHALATDDKTEHDGCRRFPGPARDNLKSGVSRKLPFTRFAGSFPLFRCAPGGLSRCARRQVFDPLDFLADSAKRDSTFPSRVSTPSTISAGTPISRAA